MSGNKYPLVEITWEDSRQPSVGWEFVKEADIPDICECKTVGYIVKQTKRKMVVAQSIGDLQSKKMQVNGLTTIPMRCVSRIVSLDTKTK